MKSSSFYAVGLTLGVVLTNAQAIPPYPGNGFNDSDQPREVGQYFIVDDHVNVFGGALLRDDCTHDGGVLGAVMIGPPQNQQLSVIKLIPTFWVNNPDPATLPPEYANFTVPEQLAEMPRLLLCFAVEHIGGIDSGMTTFCDWVPRDLHQPFTVTTDGVRTMLIDVEYRGGRNVCTENESTWPIN